MDESVEKILATFEGRPDELIPILQAVQEEEGFLSSDAMRRIARHARVETPVKVSVPGDKSLTQRALILAALAEGESRLSGLLHGGDAESTAGALRALAAERIPTAAERAR